MTSKPEFKPVASAAVDRIKVHAAALAVAESPDAVLAALFLLHSECKDIEAGLPVRELAVNLDEVGAP